ncbi:MAG: phosphoenolpyruvate synthase, partial [Candidatus Cryptobacteroides sp.]
GAFKISRNESVNFAHIPVTDAIESFNHNDLVFSTYSFADQRIVPGVQVRGSRIVTFDAILKYGKYPLAKALSEIMAICRKELLGEVEMEFAADLRDNGDLSLKLLQVRPISSFSAESEINFDSFASGLDKVLVSSGKALGVGVISGIKHIVCISPEKFDSTRTREMAAEIAAINNEFKGKDGGYLLIGPGRWGTADPFLGIPVNWSDISEAKMIVEYGLPGFRVEPSQGTHFFQNITSLGIGYLSVDTVYGLDGNIDFDAIAALECEKEYKYASIKILPKELAAFIDHKSNKAVAGLPKEKPAED